MRGGWIKPGIFCFDIFDKMKKFQTQNFEFQLFFQILNVPVNNTKRI